MKKKKEEPAAKNDSGGPVFRKVDREKGFNKAAEFLLLLEKDAAAKVLSRLNEEELIGIAREIALIKKIDPREAERVLEEYGVPPADKRGEGPAAGGYAKAEEMLSAAFGEEKARSLLQKVEERLLPEQFSFLKEIDDERLFTLLGDESPQVTALVITQMEPHSASRFLVRLEPVVQKEVVRRVGKMEKVRPEIIRRTADTLRKKLFAQSDLSMQYIDGKNKLRNILKCMDFGDGRTILDALSEDKPELADELEKALFGIEIFLKIPQKQLQFFLRGLADRVIALMLKGEAEALKEYILGCLSERRRALVREEYEILGEVHRKEVETQQREVLALLKTKLETGDLSIMEPDDRIIF